MIDRRAAALEGFGRIETLHATILVTDPAGAVRRVVSYARPNSWRVDDPAGLLVLHTPDRHVERGPDGGLRAVVGEAGWFPDAELGFLGWGHPDLLHGAGPLPSGPVSSQPPSASRIAGREVARETFAMSGKVCDVWFEPEFSLPLRQSTTLRRTGEIHEVTVEHLELNRALPGGTFDTQPHAGLPTETRAPEEARRATAVPDQEEQHTTSWST